MRLNMTPVSEELKKEIAEMLNTAEDKSAAIADAMEKVAAETQQALIQQVVAEAERASHDAEYKKTLGLANLSENEKKFFEMLKAGAKMAVTADQIDIIPTETVDRTLADVRTEYPITGLINFAPANVKHWLTGSKTGGAVWGALTAALTSSGELSATITALNIEVNKLYAYCIIPKAIRDLEIGYVEKYFRAILKEAMYDGIVTGYLDGDGKVAPIGILRQIGTVGQDGTHTAKTVNATLTGFSPKQLAPVLTALSKNGKRAVREIVVIANPADVYAYVNPALYGDSISGGYVNKSFMPTRVIEEPNMPANKAVITMPGVYTMGFSGMKVNDYKETKALEDADLLIAKVYGNGRAEDDNCAYVFNPTKLEEYKPHVVSESAE
jgi:HK97 family phage major capsid protein